MIENLEEKLAGNIPVNRKELIDLISSWGRTLNMDLSYENIIIEVSKPKECYQLENLDVSQIEDFYVAFLCSLYNGNKLNWNTSKAKNMERMFEESIFDGDLSTFNLENCRTINGMFYGAKFNNDSLNNWNVSNIEEMYCTFNNSEFCGDISNWNINPDVDMAATFNYNKNFLNKYNNGNLLSNLSSEKTVKWFLENQQKMREINSNKEECLDTLSF